MPEPSSTHLVLIPSHNTGSRLVKTARAAINSWSPVWVVIDGSADSSEEEVQELAKDHKHLRLLRVNPERGQGGAILFGAQAAEKMGYTHVLTLDADGEQPATEIQRFMSASLEAPAALVVGVPQFSSKESALRVKGRMLSNLLATLETLFGGIGDSLFCLRVYPIAHLRAVMEWHPFGRRSGFEAESAVRLSWRRLPTINLPCPARHLPDGKLGLPRHFALRKLATLGLTHLRLLLGGLIRLPYLLLLRIGILKKRR